MKHIVSFLFIVLSLSTIAQTKSNQNSPPLFEALASSAGMSEERLARIDAMCEEAVEQNKIPGMVALIARNGKIVYYKDSLQKKISINFHQ